MKCKHVAVITTSLYTTENGYVVFESCQHRGAHVDILLDGSAKNPNKTGVWRIWAILLKMSTVMSPVLCSSLILMLRVLLYLQNKLDQCHSFSIISLRLNHEKLFTKITNLLNFGNP